MVKQYNVPIFPYCDRAMELVQASLRPYGVFTDGHGNLDRTGFFQEEVPCAGRMIVIKTLKEDAARTAYAVLQGIEGLIVLPVTECSHEEDAAREEDVARFAAMRRERDIIDLDFLTTVRMDLSQRVVSGNVHER